DAGPDLRARPAGEMGDGTAAARALDADGDGRLAGQLLLVGLLDPALADRVAGLVGDAELLRLGGGGPHHVAGHQLERWRLSDCARRAEHGAVGREHRRAWPP